MLCDGQTQPESVLPMQNGEGLLTDCLVCISYELKEEWVGLEVNLSHSLSKQNTLSKFHAKSLRTQDVLFITRYQLQHPQIQGRPPKPPAQSL